MKKLIIGLVVLSAFCIALNFAHTEEINGVVVNKFLTQQKISATDGNQITTYEYLVITNKGTFQISTEGIYSANEHFGKIKEGDTIDIVTRGFGLEVLGAYRNIVEVK